MMLQVKRAAKLLLRRSKPAGRNLTVYRDDTFIVSYPKSGNTWVRFLVGNLIYRHDPVTFANVEGRIPDIYQNSDKELRRVPRPRILKSHEYFDPRYKKVLYIVRDPRDVLVSYYHYHVKIGLIEDGYPIGEYMPQFISGELDPLGPWGENVGSWLGAKEGRDEFFLLRYERMLGDPVGELRKIASFLSIPATTEQLASAVELSHADHMRALEEEQSDLWSTTRGSRKIKPFVRSARAGGWKEELPTSLAADVEEAWGDVMRQLGYQLS